MTTIVDLTGSNPVVQIEVTPSNSPAPTIAVTPPTQVLLQVETTVLPDSLPPIPADRLPANTATKGDVADSMQAHLAADNPHVQYVTASQVLAAIAEQLNGLVMDGGGVDALAAHIAASDPHPQYTTGLEVAAAINGAIAELNLGQYATVVLVDDALAAHIAASDPHPQYTTGLEVSTAVEQAITSHSNDLDPHPQYTTAAEANSAINSAVSSALSSHTSAADPHSQYTTDAEVGTAIGSALSSHTSATNPHSQYATSAALSSALSSHTSAADPHSQYTTDAEVGTAGSALSSHTSAANPHSQYRRSDTPVPAADIAHGALKAYRPGVTVSASKSLASSDAGTLQYCTNSGAITITVDPDSTTNFDTWTEVDLLRAGAGTVTIAGGAGVTINRKGTGALQLSATGSPVQLKKVGANSWYLLGDLV